jgi:hypothetical protein
LLVAAIRWPCVALRPNHATFLSARLWTKPLRKRRAETYSTETKQCRDDNELCHGAPLFRESVPPSKQSLNERGLTGCDIRHKNFDLFCTIGTGRLRLARIAKNGNPKRRRYAALGTQNRRRKAETTRRAALAISEHATSHHALRLTLRRGAGCGVRPCVISSCR